MGLRFGNYGGGLIREAPPANPVFFMPVCLVEAGATSKVHADLHLRCRRAPAGIDDPLAVLGGWRRWRVEHPENSVCNRRPSRSFRLKSFNSHRDRVRLVAKHRAVVTFGLLWVLAFEKISTVTEIRGVLVEKRTTVVTFGLFVGTFGFFWCPCVPTVSTVTGIAGPVRGLDAFFCVCALDADPCAP